MIRRANDPPNDEVRATAPDVERLARWLDDAFTVPGTRFRVGWDGILGMVPGVGELVTTVPAIWIVLRAVSMGVPGPVAARMVGNIALENVIGTIPVVGDLFDFAWKANRRNLRLLARYQRDPTGTRLRSAGALAVALVAVVLVAVILVAIPLMIVAALLRWAGGAA